MNPQENKNETKYLFQAFRSMVINNLSDILVWFPARILWEIKERAYSTKKESKKLTCRWLYRSSLAGPPLLEGKRDSLDFNLLLESTRSGPRFFRNTGTGKPKDLLSFSNNSTLIRLTNLLWGWTRRRSSVVVLITFVMCLKFRLRRWWWNGGIGIVVGKEVFSKDPWSCDCSCQENLPHFVNFWERRVVSEAAQRLSYGLWIWVGGASGLISRVSRFLSFAFNF